MSITDIVYILFMMVVLIVYCISTWISIKRSNRLASLEEKAYKKSNDRVLFKEIGGKSWILLDFPAAPINKNPQVTTENVIKKVENVEKVTTNVKPTEAPQTDNKPLKIEKIVQKESNSPVITTEKPEI